MQTIENIWNITDKEEIEEDILIILRFQWKYMNATNVAKEEIQEILKESNWSKSLHFISVRPIQVKSVSAEYSAELSAE